MGDGPTLKFYNTLTREKAEFKPINSQNVRMYVCGPTVYDFAHIGNARPVIVFDVLYRLLRHVYGENHVTYVRNITDVDDKINARALRDFPGLPLNDAIRNVTEKTTEQFQADVKALGCLTPEDVNDPGKPQRFFQPRATDNIVQMIEIIQRLLDKKDQTGRNHAYIVNGSEGREVLFSVPSMLDYGQLSKRKLEDQQAGARVAVEAHKRNPGDFVLWKESAENEPGWHAEFVSDGSKATIFGRPGWHIECSAMSQRYLGDTFDIHGGGLDLIFPHHENEIAQSRCANGTSVLANVWMHNGFLQVEGKKMSKSEGNFVTIAELLHTEKFGGRKWPGEVLRLAMLMTHYRQPIDFSMKRLEEAEGILQTWVNVQKVASNENWMKLNNARYDILQVEDVAACLADDLNTVGAITVLQHLAKDGLKGNAESARKLINAAYFLGFTLDEFVSDEDVNNMEVALQIKKRLELLEAKNFAEADKIRDELLAQGIQLKDGKDPATGERVTTWELKR